MSTSRLLLAFLRERQGAALLTILLMALGVSVIVMLLAAERQLAQHLQRDAAGIDLVVGAKGSPLQLVLSAVYHTDIPTGNIPLRAIETLSRNRAVARAVPLALGDTFSGFRIVGTERDFFDLYGARLAEGRMWTQPMQAVIGSAVARQTGLSVGSRFVGTHGLGGHGNHAHSDHPYAVVGVLAPTGTVVDRLVLTGVASVHALHQREAEAKGEITAVLVQYRSPQAALSLPRWINRATPWQAASPALEITRLYQMLDGAFALLRMVGIGVMVAAVASLLIALYANLERRLYDLAVLRAVGWSRRRVAGLVLAEGVTLAGVGAFGGWLLGSVGVPFFAHIADLPLTLGIGLAPGQLWVVAAALGLSALVCLVPVRQAYRMDMTDRLGRR
jgi:putative ABC transport system permease protein